MITATDADLHHRKHFTTRFAVLSRADPHDTKAFLLCETVVFVVDVVVPREG